VRNANWSLTMKDGALSLASTIHTDAALRLDLTPAKPHVIFGKDGVSRKGASEQAASHYITFPRLRCQGSVRLGQEDLPVTGEAWMDHEFSSSQLDDGQAGWDWAAIQLNDGTEVMVYRMRMQDGSMDPHGSTLAWISADAQVRHLASADFQWQPGGIWVSPRSGNRYPTRPEIRAEGRVFRLVPLHEDQELHGGPTGITYWEGACQVLNEKDEAVGRAFLELAGYSSDLRQHLTGSTQAPSTAR
jgi:predicted secreted hydrolase